WMVAGVAPALQRDYFGFLGWRGHDDALWQSLRDAAQDRALEGLRGLRPCFFGSDSDSRMIAIATHNLQSAGVAGFVMLDKHSAEHLQAPAGFKTGLVITNPPYGERMGDLATLPALYKALGERLRAGFAGWRAAVLTSEPELERALGLRPDKQYVLFNGAIECRLDVCEVRDQTAASAAATLSPGAEMVANRIRKNLRNLRKELSRTGVTCFRAYDADLPARAGIRAARERRRECREDTLAGPAARGPRGDGCAARTPRHQDAHARQG